MHSGGNKHSHFAVLLHRIVHDFSIDHITHPTKATTMVKLFAPSAAQVGVVDPLNQMQRQSIQEDSQGQFCLVLIELIK